LGASAPATTIRNLREEGKKRVEEYIEENINMVNDQDDIIEMQKKFSGDNMVSGYAQQRVSEVVKKNPDVQARIRMSLKSKTEAEKKEKLSKANIQANIDSGYKEAYSRANPQATEEQIDKQMEMVLDGEEPAMKDYNLWQSTHDHVDMAEDGTIRPVSVTDETKRKQRNLESARNVIAETGGFGIYDESIGEIVNEEIAQNPVLTELAGDTPDLDQKFSISESTKPSAVRIEWDQEDIETMTADVMTQVNQDIADVETAINNVISDAGVDDANTIEVLQSDIYNQVKKETKNNVMLAGESIKEKRIEEMADEFDRVTQKAVAIEYGDHFATIVDDEDGVRSYLLGIGEPNDAYAYHPGKLGDLTQEMYDHLDMVFNNPETANPDDPALAIWNDATNAFNRSEAMKRDAESAATLGNQIAIQKALEETRPLAPNLTAEDVTVVTDDNNKKFFTTIGMAEMVNTAINMPDNDPDKKSIMEQLNTTKVGSFYGVKNTGISEGKVEIKTQDGNTVMLRRFDTPENTIGMQDKGARDLITHGYRSADSNMMVDAWSGDAGSFKVKYIDQSKHNQVNLLNQCCYTCTY